VCVSYNVDCVFFLSSCVGARIHSYVLVYIAITQSNNCKVVIIVISWCQTIIITNFGNSSLHDASEVDCKVLRHRAPVSHSDTVANMHSRWHVALGLPLHTKTIVQTDHFHLQQLFQKYPVMHY